jgi:hypothetical protein
MSTAVMTEWTPPPSPRFKARLAGAFWLLTIVTGTLAMVVYGRVVVPGDAAATAAAILAREPLFRLGIATNLVAGAAYLAATLLVYDLLRPVNRSLSLLAAFFSLVGCAVGALSGLFHLAPLVVLGGSKHLSAFTAEQLQGLALLFLRLHAQAANIGFVFFGLHCLLVGWLILRSALIPRLVGVLMALAGLGWLTHSLASLLSPPLGRALSSYVMASGALGEGSLTVWLLVMGVNLRRSARS